MNPDHIDLESYPLERPDSEAYRSLIEDLRHQLAKDGLVTLPGFLTAAGIEAFMGEVEARLPGAYYSEHQPGAYYDSFPYPLPRQGLTSKSHCLGRDKLRGSAMEQLYLWPAMADLVAAVTGNAQVYLHEDPCNALIVQAYKEGCEVGWHFDSTLFTSILILSAPQVGGLFEVVPDLRSDEDPCYRQVHEVLEGRSSRVQRHALAAGCLCLMRGRHSFHRVSKVEGEDPRTSLVLTYEREPGARLDWAARKRIFGPDAPESLSGRN